MKKEHSDRLAKTSQDTLIVEGEVMYDTKAVFTNQGFSYLKELDVQVKSMVASAQSKDGKHRTYFCTVCEKEGVHRAFPFLAIFVKKASGPKTALGCTSRVIVSLLRPKPTYLTKNMDSRTKQHKVHQDKL